MTGICKRCENCPSCINGQCGEIVYLQHDVLLTALLYERCVCDVAKEKEVRDGDQKLS